MNNVKIITQDQYPTWLQDHLSLITGVAVNGCGTHPGFRFDPNVNAHSHTGNDSPGWICYKDEDTFEDERVGLHEVAHLMDPKAGHSFRWEKNFISIGGDPEEDPTCQLLDGIRKGDMNAIFTAMANNINPYQGDK